MRRALVAPLLSALVLPGLGQVINGQNKKGAVLMAAVGLLFMAALVIAAVKVSGAMAAVADGLAPGADKWDALSAQLRAQGLGWLWAVLLPLVGLWAYAVGDALKGGVMRDRAGI